MIFLFISYYKHAIIERSYILEILQMIN